MCDGLMVVGEVARPSGTGLFRGGLPSTSQATDCGNLADERADSEIGASESLQLDESLVALIKSRPWRKQRSLKKGSPDANKSRD